MQNSMKNVMKNGLHLYVHMQALCIQKMQLKRYHCTKGYFLHSFQTPPNEVYMCWCEMIGFKYLHLQMHTLKSQLKMMTISCW